VVELPVRAFVTDVSDIALPSTYQTHPAVDLLPSYVIAI
jgi:hypothetical protein